MPFIFPKRVLRDGDMLSKADMNADWQPIGELASGGLDSHNLDSASLGVNVVVADGAFHKNYYVEEGVEGGWGDNTGYTVPTLAGPPPAGAWIVPITSNWSTVDSMTISSIITGVSKLWIVAWAAYIYYGFSSTNAARGGHTATAGFFEDAGLQLAIRVDGQILPETITGHADDRYQPHQAMKPSQQRDTLNADATKKGMPGPGLNKSHIIRGHGPQASALRIVAEAPVGPGNHTVEMVARVVQKENPLASLVTATTTVVSIHNRKLFVLDCPVFPVTAPSRTAVEIPAFDDASVVSTANMATNRMTVLTTALNDLDEGHLARGALTNRHLPDVPLDVSYTWIRPTGPVEYDCKYPGYGTNSIAATRTGNAAGWTWVQDTTGPKYLRTDEDLDRPAGDIVTSGSTDCVIIVMADVQLHEIDGGSGERAGQSPAITDFAAFAIAYKINGAAPGTDIEVLGNTEAYFNNHVWWAYAGADEVSRPLEASVPLFHVFNLSPQTLPDAGAPQAADIDYIGVVTSGFSTSQTGGGVINIVPDNWCQRGALTMLKLRG